MFNLKDKVVIITGGAGFLGQRHVQAVAEFGAFPIILDLSSEMSEKAAKDIAQEYGVRSVGLGVDITDENQIQDACKQIVQEFGSVDVLINNAANNPQVGEDGLKNTSRLEFFPLDTWQKDIAVGLTGAFLCSKYFGHQISKNKTGGSIINISSDLGLIAPDQRLYQKSGVPDAQQSVKPVTYSVVKTGLIGLTRYLATYWAEKNVRCNALCPGGVFNGQDEAFVKEVCSRIPMARMAQPDEYKGAIVFLASQASSYMNGAILSIDGGRVAW